MRKNRCGKQLSVAHYTLSILDGKQEVQSKETLQLPPKRLRQHARHQHVQLSLRLDLRRTDRFRFGLYVVDAQRATMRRGVQCRIRPADSQTGQFRNLNR